MNKKGLSLLEILIALVVFSLVMLGVSRLLLSAKELFLHNRLKILGEGVGIFHLDSLQMDVRKDTWGLPSNCLTNPATGCDTISWQDPVSGKVFTPRYEVTGMGNLQKIKVIVSWTE